MANALSTREQLAHLATALTLRPQLVMLDMAASLGETCALFDR